MTIEIRCRYCDGRKFVKSADTGRWVPCECLRSYRLERAYEDCRIPPVFWRYTWSDFADQFPRMRNVLKGSRKLVEYVAGPGKSGRFLYVVGEAESGKQALAVLFLKDFIAKGLRCKMVSLDELIEMGFDRERRHELDGICGGEYDVVCLRLGTVQQHSYARIMLERFYNARRQAGRYAMFTARVDVEGSAGLYGQEMAKVFSDNRRIIKMVMR